MTFVGEKDLSDYFDFPVLEGNEKAFFSALCDHLADPNLDWKLLDLPSLREDSPTLEYLPALAEQRGPEGRDREGSDNSSGPSCLARGTSTWRVSGRKTGTSYGENCDGLSGQTAPISTCA